MNKLTKAAAASEPEMLKYWSLPPAAACSRLSCNDKGLSGEEAVARRRKYGENILQSPSGSGPVWLYLSQFKNPITVLLIIAALLSVFFGDTTDSVIILFIILASSLLGFWQENGAAKSLQQLLKIVQIRCTIVRDGLAAEFPVNELVPGDVIMLSSGDLIPGDALVLTASAAFVDEAAFTGETFPVEKSPGILAPETLVAKRSNSLFMGSHVDSGKMTALVINTGTRTEFGKIAARLRSKAPETQFESGIRHFGYFLMQVTLILVISIFAINVLLHKPVIESFLFSLALAVGLTPQLLPAILSVNLSVGAKIMAKQQVIVKRLSSIENIGSMNILCSDKTGTITEGLATFKDSLDIAGLHSDKVHLYAYLNASKQQGYKNPVDAAIQIGFSPDCSGYIVKTEVPYDFFRKRLTVLFQHGQENIAITKGAFTEVLKICTTVENDAGVVVPLGDLSAGIAAEYERHSRQGFRVLGVAYKVVDDQSGTFTRSDENAMTFLGFILLFDPLKKGVSETIAALQKLGVSLKIITGDSALAGERLASDIGIIAPVITTGSQLNEMSDQALFQRAVLTNIFVEVDPNQKERIILLLKRSGNVVGFLGDGVNDAPALHAADVGISVDTAVDVAREAADIVLMSQDLNVLLQGVIAGRKTFTNTMKYIFMATSANFGTMFSMAGASLFLPFLPLLPKQILLNNLLTDFPEMTIATDRVDQIDIAQPHRWNIHFIKKFMIVFGLISSVFDFVTFGVLLHYMHAGEAAFQTGWFTESVISQILIVMVIRTKLPFVKSLPGKYLVLATGTVALFVLLIPVFPFYHLLGFVRLPFAFYCWLLLIVAGYLLVSEFVKRIFYRKMVSASASTSIH